MRAPTPADLGVTESALATDPGRLSALFGDPADLLPLWIAEPYLPVADEITAAVGSRAAVGWFGYESRPDGLMEAFWSWAADRHGWSPAGLQTSVSPSVGTSIGVMIDQHTEPGDGVILQPPVFTDFKPLVTAAGRNVVKNPLVETADGYRMDLEGLAAAAADPGTRLMILCNPHNPVGRVWSPEELAGVAEVCAAHDVFVVADEIHADLALPPHRFTPFAAAAAGTGLRWAATHGPIKTFGVAGLCDTLLITADDEVTERYRERSSQYHLTRNNVASMVGFEAAYRDGAGWVDRLLALIAANVAVLRERLPEPIRLVETEATYLAWLDLRALGMEVPELAAWLAGSARLALSPGHWFGREGAGFARMTIAAPTGMITEAADRLAAAASSL